MEFHPVTPKDLEIKIEQPDQAFPRARSQAELILEAKVFVLSITYRFSEAVRFGLEVALSICASGFPPTQYQGLQLVRGRDGGRF